MKKIINQYKLISEKEAAKMHEMWDAHFNYYARVGRGPEPALITPDGRRWYEEETVLGWSKPPRINAKGGNRWKN